MCIIKAIEKAFKTKKERGWEKIYVAVDLHGTVIKPNYISGDIPQEYYDLSLDVLKIMSNRKDIVLILYTCSWPDEIEQYLEFFDRYGVQFEYINSNPEVLSEPFGYGYYVDKFYFNVLLDDKAGFDPESEWSLILDVLKNDSNG